MDLNSIAGPIVAAVNPQLQVTVRVSTGAATAGDGNRAPAYAAAVSVLGQVQPLTSGDLRQLDGINLGGARWKIYLTGQVDGIVRAEKKGGDLVTIPPPSPHAGTWLVVQVLEQFQDWVCAAIVLQNGG